MPALGAADMLSTEGALDVKRALAVLLALTLLPGQTRACWRTGRKRAEGVGAGVLAALAVRAGTQPKLRQLKTGVREECVADVFLYTDSHSRVGKNAVQQFLECCRDGCVGVAVTAEDVTEIERLEALRVPKTTLHDKIRRHGLGS